MIRRVVLPAVLAAALLGAGAASAQGRPRWPSRSTPLSSTLGWFRAINHHDRARLLSYVAPRARFMMDWARPSERWSRYTRLRCRVTRASGRTRADVFCTFRESASAVRGQPSSSWYVLLTRTRAGWLIDNYGVG